MKVLTELKEGREIDVKYGMVWSRDREPIGKQVSHVMSHQPLPLVSIDIHVQCIGILCETRIEMVVKQIKCTSRELPF